MKTKQNDNLHNAMKSTNIAVKVVLVLGGLALLALFGWLGYSICMWLGV